MFSHVYVNNAMNPPYLIQSQTIICVFISIMLLQSTAYETKIKLK